MKNQCITYMLVSIILTFLFGCSGISATDIIPRINSAPSYRFPQSIKVCAVRGAKKEYFGGPVVVSSDVYKEALVLSLKSSNLFRSVSTEGHSDIEIYMDIIAHGDNAQASVIQNDYKSAMVIDYRIVNAQTKQEVWRKSFNSRESVSISQKFSGVARTKEAQIGSAKSNIAQLINSLSVATF